MNAEWMLHICRAFTIVAALAMAAGAPCALGQSRAAQPIDDELMKDLGGDPANELGRALGGKGKRPQGQPGAPATKPGGPQSADVNGDTASAADAGNPLLVVARRMRQAQQQIDGNQSGPATQTLQQHIIADLDRLIEEARKSCSGSSACNKPGQGASGNPGQAPTRPSASQPQQQSQQAPPQPPKEKPAATSNERRTQAAKGQQTDTAESLEMMKKVWGVLPPHEQQQLLQLPAEEFLPKYQQLIEEYYRRLSEGGGRTDEAKR
jgi:hypothetical protein